MTTETEMKSESPQDQKLPFEGDRKVIVRTRVRAQCFAQGCCAPPEYVHYYLYRNPVNNIRSVAFGLGQHDITTDMFDYKRYCCTVHRQLEQDSPTPVECVSRPMHRAKDWPERFLIDEDVAVGGELERQFLIGYDGLLNRDVEKQFDDGQSAERDIQDAPAERGPQTDDNGGDAGSVPQPVDDNGGSAETDGGGDGDE